MADSEAVQRNLELQRQWYGEPLGTRVRRLVVAYDVSQSNLAEVLGVSSSMLSQVMSGRRAKIGNPVTLAKMLMLERKVLTPGVAEGRPEALQQALDDVKAAQPSVTVDNVPVESGEAYAAISFLRQLAEPADLAEAAGLLHARFPQLAVLFRRASRSRSRR